MFTASPEPLTLRAAPEASRARITGDVWPVLCTDANGAPNAGVTAWAEMAAVAMALAAQVWSALWCTWMILDTAPSFQTGDAESPGPRFLLVLVAVHVPPQHEVPAIGALVAEEVLVAAGRGCRRAIAPRTPDSQLFKCFCDPLLPEPPGIVLEPRGVVHDVLADGHGQTAAQPGRPVGGLRRRVG